MFPARTSPTGVEPDEVPYASWVSPVPLMLAQNFECAWALQDAEVLGLNNTPQLTLPPVVIPVGDPW